MLDQFIIDDNKRILIGTKLVSEGIDISNIKLALLFDTLPEIDVYIQVTGRLR